MCTYVENACAGWFFSPVYLVVEIFYLFILLQVKHPRDSFQKPWVILINKNFELKLYRKTPTLVSFIFRNPVNIKTISIYKIIQDDRSRNTPGDDR